MSFFRYPGGKTKLSLKIIDKINAQINNNENIIEYREPFFGGGSIGLEFLKKSPEHIKTIWINDYDVGISSLWSSIINHPAKLINEIMKFEPTVEDFYKFKYELENLEQLDNIVDIGFKKLAIHQISYSGLGVKSGGPLGGKLQKSEYKVNCRWSPKYICKKIVAVSELFNKFDIKADKCTSYDFINALEDDSNLSIIYLDPPYYDKGNELYQFSFNEHDHIRLCEGLKKTKHSWVLSYDDCKEIRELYQWATIEEISANYTIKGSRTKTELLIYPKG